MWISQIFLKSIEVHEGCSLVEVLESVKTQLNLTI